MGTLRYKARMRYAAGLSNWRVIMGAPLLSWFPDTIYVLPPDRPKGSVRRNKHGVVDWDQTLLMDGVRGPLYPQNHCTRLW